MVGPSKEAGPILLRFCLFIKLDDSAILYPTKLELAGQVDKIIDFAESLIAIKGTVDLCCE